MEETAKNGITQNLKRKFDALKEHKTDKDFFVFSVAYTEYICNSVELSPAIKKLVDDGKISPRALQQIYNDYITIPYLRDYKDNRHNHLCFPKFYDQDIEKMFKLHKKFCELTGNDYEITKTNPELIKIDCDQPMKRNFQNEYADIQRLHNDLLELLELNEGKILENTKVQEIGGNKAIPINELKTKIGKITIIKMNDGNFFIAVNDNYEEIKEIKKQSKWWKIFIVEVEARNVRPETRTDVKEISKEMADYFNYNSKCPVYMGGKYDLTEIITGKDIDRVINPEIKTKSITEKQYSTIKSKGRRK